MMCYHMLAKAYFQEEGNQLRRSIICWMLVLLLASGCGTTARPPENTQGAASDTPGTANREGPAEQSKSFFAMDTYMSLRFWGGSDGLPEKAEQLVLDMEAALSTTAEDSEIACLNDSGDGELSADTAELLGRALELCGELNGALDISIYPVVRAWGFTNPEGGYRVPAPEELQELLAQVDYRRVSLDGTHARLEPGMQIDLGAVTKGCLGDRLSRLLCENGVKSGLLDLGGNIQVIGMKPDGTPWRIGVQDPAGDSYLGVLAVSDCAVVTSGGYERYFIDENGTLHWHILDPADGFPAENGLISVTVVGSEGLYCDALSTGLFILGPERAMDFWQARRDFEMVLVTEDRQILLTPALASRFKPSEDCGYEIEVIADAKNENLDMDRRFDSSDLRPALLACSDG